MTMEPRHFCDKLDRDAEQWNRAFPNKPPRKMKCGYPLPCPFHTVIIDTAGPRVHIPAGANTTQKQRKAIRRAAVEISDALED
jgi:hypothetical protein